MNPVQKDADKASGTQPFVMGVGFMLNKLDSISILVENDLPMFPYTWTAGATTRNWQLYTNMNPKNDNEKGLKEKLSRANG